mgnify:CR=1 FL=1
MNPAISLSSENFFLVLSDCVLVTGIPSPAKKIASSIKETHKVDINESSIKLIDKIKETGSYDITIELLKDTSFQIKLEIKEKTGDTKKS